MTTKYLLHGGAAQHVNPENDKFFTEILKGTNNNPRILLVHFASKADRKEVNKERDTSQFLRSRGDKNLSFDIAEEASFLMQIQKADVIYLGGGTTPNLLNALTKFENLRQHFEGKIVAGESAGANTISAYCYSKSAGGVLKCLGIVPFATIPHYQPGLEKEFINISQDIERLLLPEYQFKIYIK